MSEGQALVTMDGVHATLTETDGSRKYHWDIFAEPAAGADRPVERAAKGGKPIRSITAIVRDGVVTSAHEIVHD